MNRLSSNRNRSRHEDKPFEVVFGYSSKSGGRERSYFVGLSSSETNGGVMRCGAVIDIDV